MLPRRPPRTHSRRRVLPAFRLRVALAAALITLLPTLVPAAPVPGAPFTDFVVLQRDRSVPIWGTAAPGERIRVNYRQATATTVTGPDGRWRVDLPPLDLGPESDLTITGDTTVTLHHVAVGDVWIIAGQSNAEWPLAKSDAAGTTVASDVLPWLRHLRIPHRVSHREEPGIAAVWTPATLSSVQDVSAVGICFVRHLYRRGDVPVGLIQVTYGGTIIESWLSPRALLHAPAGPVVNRRWDETLVQWPSAQAAWLAANDTWTKAKSKAEQAGTRFTLPALRAPVGPGHPSQVSGLHHGMLAPLLPSAVKGVIWYQGESNVGRPAEYAGLLTALIADWRGAFGRADLPFLLVQLPNYRDPRDAWWKVRDAQAQVAQAMPGCHLAVIIDLGASRDKHPRNKDEVGRRLSLLARRYVFGESVEAEAPAVISAVRDGPRARLTFLPSDVPISLRPASPTSISFELAGTDGVHHPATARVSDGGVIVETPSVPVPMSVRYLKHNDPTPTLFSTSGLPVAPFQQVIVTSPTSPSPRS